MERELGCLWMGLAGETGIGGQGGRGERRLGVRFRRDMVTS